MLRVILKMEMCVSLSLLWECGANLMYACDCFLFLIVIHVDTTHDHWNFRRFVHVVVRVYYRKSVPFYACICTRDGWFDDVCANTNARVRMVPLAVPLALISQSLLAPFLTWWLWENLIWLWEIWADSGKIELTPRNIPSHKIREKIGDSHWWLLLLLLLLIVVQQDQSSFVLERLPYAGGVAASLPIFCFFFLGSSFKN